jgi:hypothetical protein
MRDYTTINFEANLKNVKHASIVWAHGKKERDEKNHIEVEASIDTLYNNECSEFLKENTKDELKSLEQIRRKIFVDKEASCGIKSRDL